jgi:hypothetical protein
VATEEKFGKTSVAFFHYKKNPCFAILVLSLEVACFLSVENVFLSYQLTLLSISLQRKRIILVYHRDLKAVVREEGHF